MFKFLMVNNNDLILPPELGGNQRGLNKCTVFLCFPTMQRY